MSPRPPDHSDNEPNVPEPSDGTNPNGTAAERIIEKFGGIRPMAHKLNMPVTTVQGWKKRGAIPSNRHPDLLAAASRHNVTLDQAELDAAAPADERSAEESSTIIVSGSEPLAAQSATTPEPEQPADTTAGTPWTSPRSYEQPASASTSPVAASEVETNAEPVRSTPEPVRAAEPARASGGGKGLATFAILLALLGTGAAVTAPIWGPRVIPQVWPPQAGGGDLSGQVAALDQRVQQLASRGSDTAPLNDRLAQLEQQLDAVRQQSQQQNQGQPAASGEAAPAASGVDQAQVEQIVQAQVQPLASRLGAVEQRPQPRPGLDQQALDARVVPLEQQLLAVAQIRDRIQGLEGRLGTLDQQGQAINRLNQSVAGLEQEANRLAQEISSTATRAAKVAETVTLRQAEESKAQALVLAAGQLRATLQSSRPFTGELSAVRAVNLQDPQVTAALKAIEPYAADGIPTEAQLNQQFSDVAGEIVRAGVLASGQSGQWWDKALSTASSLVSVRRTAGEIQGSGADAVTARAEQHIKASRLDEAVKELETLTGEPAAVAKPWIDDAKARLAANNAGALLTGQAIARLAGSTGGTQ
jgi:ribosomal protein S16